MKTEIKPVKTSNLSACPVGWWNQGSVRIQMSSWKDLAKDDWKQRQGRKGPGGKGGWDPTRGFRVRSAAQGGLNSGPTPAVRQAFERPVRTAMQGARLVGRGARAVASVVSALASLGRFK